MNKFSHIPDDLDYLAEQGFEKSGDMEKEIQQLERRVTKKYGNFRLPMFVVGIFIGGIVVTGIFLLLNKNKTNESLALKKELAIQENMENTLGIDSTVMVKENDLNTNNKIVSQEHFMRSNVNNHLSENISMNDVVVESMTGVKIHKVGNSDNISQKDLLEMLPNAPVIFIRDLKITDYQKLYFKNEKAFTLRNGGLQSHYENIIGYTSPSETKGQFTLVEILQQALEEFNQNNFKKSLGLFNVLLEYNVADVNARFYTALCQFHLGYHTAAIKSFDQILDNNNNVFHQEANWYKALSLQAAGEKEKATTLFIKISEQKGFYADQATQKIQNK